MSFLNPNEVTDIKDKLVTDLSHLGKIYKAKKSKYFLKSVDHSLVDEMLKSGWEEAGAPLATKTRLRKLKDSAKQFEHDIWCQFYELGYRNLNYDENFVLPFGKDPTERKQIDVIAIDKDTIIIVECKSSEKAKSAPSYKTEFEGLERRLDGFKKSMEQVFGKGKKVKYIFATRRLRIDIDGVDIQRLEKTGSFYYNDNTYEYLNSLIRSYKGAARYQFLGILFKDQLINTTRLEVPAIEGEMGGKKYYMFSLEPHLLLKMGFILHRTKANESEMPTYQRLLIPSRLSGIQKFIDKGGYFPNSVIINFSQRKHKIQFEYSSRSADTYSRFGTLKIPNAYAVAYIIDGQHRVYGYANSEFKETNTIPVVAFLDLSSTEQLEIFMDINQNQKAVSPSLRLTLEEDLYWESDRADSRIKALRSSIIKELSGSVNGPLYNKISIGEDPGLLTFKPFADSLLRSGLLPTAKGNLYKTESCVACLYNTHNQNHGAEMIRAKKNIVSFLNLCYGFVEEKFYDLYSKEQSFIMSNRGTFAFINLIGSLNLFETNEGNVNIKTTPVERFESIKKYLQKLFNELQFLESKERDDILKALGTGAEVVWFRFFQTIVNKHFKKYNPIELVDWKERQDEDLQDEGRKYSKKIESFMKKKVIEKLKILYGENWDIEIGKIQRECETRAKQEIEKQYKEGLGRKDIPWTDMFFITDYKEIIEKNWTSLPEIKSENFVTFEKEFSIDAGYGFNSKQDKLKWISVLNSHRNVLAHDGTKDKGLNKEEVAFLETIHNHFFSKK